MVGLTVLLYGQFSEMDDYLGKVRGLTFSNLNQLNLDPQADGTPIRFPNKQENAIGILNLCVYLSDKP